jgi:hypothetical protein
MRGGGENIGVDLQWAWATRDQVHLLALIRGNPLNQEGVGPTASAYIMVKWTNVHTSHIQYTYTEGSIPYGTVAVGCVTVRCSSSPTSVSPPVHVLLQALRYETPLPCDLMSYDSRSTMIHRVESLLVQTLIDPCTKTSDGTTDTVLYTDDTAVFVNPVKVDMDIVMHIMQRFGEPTDLRINVNKSTVAPIKCSQVNLGEVL